MAIKPNIKLDLAAFAKDARRLKDRDYPQKVALGFKELAMDARDKARDQTRQKFKLHSDYIPNGILSTPFSVSQVSKASKSVKNYGDLTAAVFLRPAGTPRRDLGFMVNHETGEDKTGTSGDLAIPWDVKRYSHRTSRGATASRWKPKTLLKDFNARPNKAGQKLNRTRRRLPFVITLRSGKKAIVRRTSTKSRPLEFLYSLTKRANIAKTWNFEGVIESHVTANYKQTLGKHLARAIK